MFNKLYENIKKFIIDNYKELLIYIVLFIVLTIRLPYFIYIGGGTIDLNKRIELKSNEKGSYHMAYVKQMHATIPTYLLQFIIPSWDLEKVEALKYDEESTSEIDEREKLYLEEANANAIINAFRLAGKEVKINSNSFKVIHVVSNADTNIEVGDELVSVDGVIINNNSEYKEYIKSKKIGDNLKVIVKRNNKEKECYAKIIDYNGEQIIGLFLVNIYDYETNPKINLNFKWNESGPSGGFMLSLALYDRLVDDDLTKGRKIVGTGTIDINGTVGEIGGVKYKLMGAVHDKADLFLVPSGNYEEAMETKKKFNYKITIVKVETLEDAVNYLKEN